MASPLQRQTTLLPFIGSGDDDAVFLHVSRGKSRQPPALKFIAFSSSLPSETSRRISQPPVSLSSSSMNTASDAVELELTRRTTILESLPIRATLHRVKQMRGRYFPPLSYSEGEKTIIDSKPTPRRIVRKLPPPTAGGKMAALSQAAAGVGLQRAASGWSWVATRVYLQAAPAGAISAAQPPNGLGGGGGGAVGSHNAAYSAPAALDPARHPVKHGSHVSALPAVVVAVPDATSHRVAGATKTLHRRLG